MTSQAGTFQRVTVAEAAAILGISPATVRRKLKAGELTGERVIRPQGSAFVVLLPRDASAAPDDASDTRHDSWRVERSNASPDSAQGAQETALAAWVVTLMAPLAEANRRQLETLERQAEQLAVLREERGRQSAELERATSAVVALHDELTAHRRRVGLLSLALAVLCALAVAGALAVAAGTAPAWVR